MKWKQTYDFVSEYEVSDMRLSSLVGLQSRLKSDNKVLNKYRSHLDGGHSLNAGNKVAYCDTFDER